MALGAATTVALVATVLGTTSGAGAAAPDRPGEARCRTAAKTGCTPFELRPSVEQLYVLDGTPGDDLELRDDTDTVVATGTVDAQGSLVWRQLAPGVYTVQVVGEDWTRSGEVTVTAFDGPPPQQSFYDDQTLTEGFQYITTRDGTTLSANVSFPSGQGDGPFPTVVEYSGYDPSNPANTTMATLFNTLGYAYVGVNVRGTGCSGGAFMTFEPVQSIDGYDAIETIAAQPWAKYHKVGMVGISYPGIEQLYVARTRPPHLAAITPLSVIDDTYRGTLYPGGILNTGFAVSWAQQRAEDAAAYGEGWEQGQVDAEAEHDVTTCADNQRVRGQNVDLGAMINANPFYSREVGDPINPSKWVHDINVPVFIAGAWQDEQTGGHFPALLNLFKGSPDVYVSMANGSHTESLGLGVFSRYADFLDLYVAHRVPSMAALAPKNLVAPVLAKSITGIEGLKLPPGIDYTGLNYQQALAKYRAQKHVRILFEEGAAAGEPSGSPIPRFVRTFDSWPIKQAKPTAWYFTPRGGLRAAPPAQRPWEAPARTYSADPDALPATDYTGPGNDIWKAHPTYDWQQIPQGKGLGWISAPLTRNVVAIGTGSVDVWVRTPARDTDLEATLTEVRPDGTEVYVQSGWLRTSHRKLDTTRSTPISPVHTDLEKDAAPLPAGRYTQVRLELFPFAQAFRAGSRLRLTIDAPGGARPLWAFDTTIAHGEKVAIAADSKHRSRIVLPVVPGVSVPTKAPACASLRSQPCRQYP